MTARATERVQKKEETARFNRAIAMLTITQCSALTITWGFISMTRHAELWVSNIWIEGEGIVLLDLLGQFLSVTEHETEREEEEEEGEGRSDQHLNQQLGLNGGLSKPEGEKRSVHGLCS